MNSEKAQVRRPSTDTDGILAALRRARRSAERLALATGTFLVVVENGKMVRVPPRAEAAVGTCEDEPAWK